MEQAFSEVENTDPAQHQRWLDKHHFTPDDKGMFPVDSFEGRMPVTVDQLFENIRTNVTDGDYTPLYTVPYDERTFVMICGGPSLGDHLDEIREKTLNPDYLVACSNMTASYLMRNGIKPHVHFIIDPQERKRFDVVSADPDIQYWINAACHPAVFQSLKEQGIKPHVFLADFDSEGKAIQAVKESMTPGQEGMMAIQGGTMAGLRALNLADAMGFRKMEYYGFDATVRVADGKAQPYAYEKKRGEAIIEIQCDRCQEKFDTTLILQRQVNEFIQWRHNMPWLDIKIIGGGLIAHYQEHLQALEKQHSKQRFTPEYAKLQRELHGGGEYGISGVLYSPPIFHAIAQLAKRHGDVSVLDYGSAAGNTMKQIREQFWIPPSVTDFCYDPMVAKHSAEPEPADLVICTDVLEHVEPECTMAVLDHLASLTKKIIFIAISLQKANKELSDGRNAHINLRPSEFWAREIKRRFVPSELRVKGNNEVLLIVAQSIEGVREIMKRERDEKKRTKVPKKISGNKNRRPGAKRPTASRRAKHRSTASA